ncbi:SnoaL-like domain-containing protein [Tumidithrix elongata RA019]|uniref:SnoaL-like domain-containing protein n=1 Tax=Tumidithrix elongata BACA0141 TaxID=2716417 RepID=A0AAW9PSY1_9CYAN|nr:SnoaL-like domain-containing protein [Tumidithrix elongata RA019]
MLRRFSYKSVLVNMKTAIFTLKLRCNAALDFFSKVTEFRGAEVKAVAYGEDVIISEWFVDYTHAEWGKVTHDQVSVQRWKDGKVVHERFYYGA